MDGSFAKVQMCSVIIVVGQVICLACVGLLSDKTGAIGNRRKMAKHKNWNSVFNTGINPGLGLQNI